MGPQYFYSKIRILGYQLEYDLDIVLINRKVTANFQDFSDSKKGDF